MTWKAKFSKKGANKGRGRGGRGRGRGGSSRTGGAQRSDSSALRLAEREMLEVEELGKRIVLEAPALAAQTRRWRRCHRHRIAFGLGRGRDLRGGDLVVRL